MKFAALTLGYSAALMASTHLLPADGMIVADAVSIEDLEAEINGLTAEAEALINAATDGDLSADDEARVDEISAAVEKKRKVLAMRQKVAAMRPPQTAQRKTTAEVDNRDRGGGGGGGGGKTVHATARKNPGMWGFNSFAEYAMTVRAATGPRGGAGDQEAITRIQNALTTYGQESVGADGGFAVPPDYRTEIIEKVTGEESLLARTDRMVTSGGTLVLPTDETVPYGDTGIQAYWENEAGQKTQSKPVLGQTSIRLNKLIALVPLTDELLQDAPGMDSYIRRKVPDVFNAKINTAIIDGTGAGQPLGLLRSNALITVSKNVSQPADSIWFENIVAMYSRMRARSLPRSAWYINQSILPQLMMMSFDPQGTVKVPIFMPGGSIATAPYGTLLGRPIIPIEAAKPVGDLGDIIFADLTQYLTVTRGQDIQTDVSIHLFFDYDVTAFRFVLRINGQPWWNGPVQPQQGSAPTLGDFVALAERS